MRREIKRFTKAFVYCFLLTSAIFGTMWSLPCIIFAITPLSEKLILEVAIFCLSISVIAGCIFAIFGQE